MASLKKAPRRTGKTMVALNVKHHTSMAAAKSGGKGSKTTHMGQPMSMPGKGLVTGGNAKNC
jgi:hypothetical protein